VTPISVFAPPVSGRERSLRLLVRAVLGGVMLAVLVPAVAVGATVVPVISTVAGGGLAGPALGFGQLPTFQ